MFALLVLLTGLQSGLIDLVPGQDPADPLGSAYVLVDDQANLDLDQVRAAPAAFRRNTSGFINPGTTPGVVWIRFDVRNPTDEPGEWILGLNRALVDPGEIHLVRQDRVETLLAHSPEAFARSYAEFGTLAGRFELLPHENASLYVRYRGGNWSGLAPRLSTPASFQRQVTADLLALFALIGGVLTLVLYTSISYLLLDRRIVLLYAVAQIALLSFYVHLCGFTTVYLWPEQPQSGQFISPLTISISVLAMLQFARRFFDTAAQLPVLDRFLKGLLGILLIAVMMLPLDYLIAGFPRWIYLYLIYLGTALAWLTLAPLALFATLKRDRDHWPLVAAWTSMGTFMVFMQLIWTGMIDAVPLEQHVYGVAVYAEAVFMALGIALRVRRIRAGQVESERRLSRSLAAELDATQRSVRLAEEREWALGDLAEKGRLILAAGHDTRQMISSLRHYALALQRGPDPARVARAGRDLQLLATNLDEVLASALEGSASGGIGDRVVALERTTASRIMTPLQLVYGSMAVQKGIDLRLRMTSGPMITDRVLVSRIIGNLLSNALKYTDAGKVLVTCRPSGDGHRFQVFDTGHGLDPRALASLLDAGTGAVQFEPGTEGHGAGFHIAKTLAARVNGVLSGSSVPGQGSRFELRLADAGCTSGEPARLVILDNDEAQRPVLLEAGNRLGIEIIRTTDPERVARLTGAGRTRVLIDEHFGGSLAGIDCARRLVDEGLGAMIAIMTYDHSIEARRRAGQVCSMIVCKPLSTELLAAVARWRTG